MWLDPLCPGLMALVVVLVAVEVVVVAASAWAWGVERPWLLTCA